MSAASVRWMFSNEGVTMGHLLVQDGAELTGQASYEGCPPRPRMSLV
jgi:hypothetical protein